MIFRNRHIQTVYPFFFRWVNGVVYQRERVETDDGDFLDLDWSCVGSRSLAVLSHGLEGDSHRYYVRGMVKALNSVNIDALAWNYRGCSGEPNRLLRMYHNGVIDDLHRVVTHAIKNGGYQTIYLVGFSLGGNLNLLYLGKWSVHIPSQVRAAVVFSAPCDLTDAANQLERRENAIYMKRFLRSLGKKIRAKKARFPQAFDDMQNSRIKTFRQFDDRYTAPIHGFADAQDYWTQCSSRPWLKRVKIPTLIVNAKDDPFLTGGCYPLKECRENPNIQLEIPLYGGHLGFVTFNANGLYWLEERALLFFNTIG